MRRWIVLLLFALVLAPVPLVVTATAASACSCAFDEPADFVGLADVVVTGTLSGPERSGLALRSDDAVWYTVIVDEVFQGEATDTMVFASAASGASCGLENIESGARYVVFLTDGSDQQPHVSDGLAASLCGGTQPYDGTGPVADALADLGGEPPQPGTTGSVPVSSGSMQPWLLGAGLALVAAGAALLVVRLRRRRS